MTANKMNAINPEQLDNVTGGTYPKRPEIIINRKYDVSPYEKSLYPDIGRHGFETGNTKSEALTGILGENEASILIMGSCII